MGPQTSDHSPGCPGDNRIDEIRPDAPALTALGTAPVGVQTLSLVNPDQIDVVNINGPDMPRYDRPLVVEIWYPAKAGTQPGGSYQTLLRDGRTEITLHGRAARNADVAAGQKYPLVVISHGYPGNRFLLSHFGENLASKGYVVVSIDHTDSTYAEQEIFGSTLLNRPLDQRFVIDCMETLASPLAAIIDTDNTGVIGYSMGGYGALVFGGAGVTEASAQFDWAPANGLLATHRAGSAHHTALVDARLKAVIAIGPWGMGRGLWDQAGLSQLEKPLMLMAGEVDDVSDYAAMRQVFAGTTGTTRHLLTFEAAGHNAAGPIPAPSDSWRPSNALDFVPFEHYADPVWDSTRMNNIAQHFATAFFDQHLKSDPSKSAFLDLLARAADGVMALDEAGNPTRQHTHWHGFAPGTAQGLRFETLRAFS